MDCVAYSIDMMTNLNPIVTIKRKKLYNQFENGNKIRYRNIFWWCVFNNSPQNRFNTIFKFVHKTCSLYPSKDINEGDAN